MMMKMPQTVSKTYIAQTRRLFHCHIKVKIPASQSEDLLDTCFELLEQIDLTYNSYQPGSYFDAINRQSGTWVNVDQPCIQLLQTAKLVSKLTLGNFDISCMPLIRLWGFYNESTTGIPSKIELEKTLNLVDYQSILIDGSRVKIKLNQELITAAFIKAYAVDQVIALLQEHGVTDAIVNAGGSSIAALNDESHPQWTIHIPDALNPQRQNQTLKISNQCFSLSARANNHKVIDGKAYGHILNSKTGLPVSTAQVGVITNKAFLGDMLSTALFSADVAEYSAQLKNLKEHFDFSSFRIEEDGRKTTDLCL